MGEALSCVSCDTTSSEAGFSAPVVPEDGFAPPKGEPELPDPNKEVVLEASVVAEVLPNAKLAEDLSELPKRLEDAGFSVVFDPKPLNGLLIVVDEVPKTDFAVVDVEEPPTLKAEGAGFPKVPKGEDVDALFDGAPKVKKDGTVGAPAEGAAGVVDKELPNRVGVAGESFDAPKGFGALVELVPLNSNKLVFGGPVETGAGVVIGFPALKPANATGGAGIAGLLLSAGADALPVGACFESDLEELSKSFWIFRRRVLYCSKRSDMSTKGSLSTVLEMAETTDVFSPRRSV